MTQKHYHRCYSEFKVHVWIWELQRDGIPICSVLAPYGWQAQTEILSSFGSIPSGTELVPVKLYTSVSMRGEIYE